MKKRNKRGIEILEIIIALAILGITAITVTRGITSAMRKNGEAVIKATDLTTQPVNTVP